MTQTHFDETGVYTFVFGLEYNVSIVSSRQTLFFSPAERSALMSKSTVSFIQQHHGTVTHGYILDSPDRECKEWPKCPHIAVQVSSIF